MANTPLYRPNLVIVVSGPSGSGKSTVVEALCEADPTLRPSVSATTRKPRPGEVNGVDYHFLSKAEFEARIQGDSFLEWAEYGDNRYGTLTSEITAARDTGRDAVLVIDPNGSHQVRKRNLALTRSIRIFIVPPSLATLEKRLRRRRTESERELKQRMDIARAELCQIQHYDYWVRNSDNEMQYAVEQIQAIIAAERSRIDDKLIEAIKPLLGVEGVEVE